MPKKVTWNAAFIAEGFEDARSYGFSFDNLSFDWNKMKSKRDAYLGRLRHMYETNLVKEKVEFINGRATFLDKNTIEVLLDHGGRQIVNATHTLISVGGQPNLPNIPGRKLCIASDGFFDIETQPSRVVTVGAGYIGVELSAIFHALGTDSHLFIRGAKVLRSFDSMVQDVITSEYERQGINIHKMSTITRVEDLGNGKKRVFYDQGDQRIFSSMRSTTFSSQSVVHP